MIGEAPEVVEDIAATTGATRVSENSAQSADSRIDNEPVRKSKCDGIDLNSEETQSNASTKTLMNGRSQQYYQSSRGSSNNRKSIEFQMWLTSHHIRPKGMPLSSPLMTVNEVRNICDWEIKNDNGNPVWCNFPINNE